MAVSFGSDIPDAGGPSRAGERLARVEGELAGIRHAQSTTKTTISLVVAVLLGGLSLMTFYNAWRFGRIEQDIAQVRTELGARIERAETGLGARMDRLEAKFDALPDRVAERIDRAVDLTLQAYRAGQGDRPPPAPPAPR